VRPEHRFEIGSVGKGFTATLVLQLAVEGLLDLHAPVTDHVPWFRVESSHGPITTHHLLTHSAGLITGSLAFIDARSEVWALRRTRTGTAPGEFFHYSDVGYETDRAHRRGDRREAVPRGAR
jgi:CubicO group peptidase (beta-lactamase class C family)